MNNTIELKNLKTGEIVYPKTLISSVMDEDGVSLEQKLASLNTLNNNFMGYFATEQDLPENMTASGWAFVGNISECDTYAFYHEAGPAGTQPDTWVKITDSVGGLVDFSDYDSIRSDVEEAKTNIANLAEAVATLEGRVVENASSLEDLSIELITLDEFRAIYPKKFKYYYVAENETKKRHLDCWRIYLKHKLIGEFVGGMLTLPKFPMRFPFRFA